MTLTIHIAAGSLGLLAGFTALYAAKAATVHRRSGIVFVCAMLTLSVTGGSMAALRNMAPVLNIPAALITAYLVVTALTTVRRGPAPRWLDAVALLVAIGVGVSCLMLGFVALASGGRRDGMPAFPFLLFGAVGALGAAGDLRVFRSGPLHGTRRLARHLWRMCFALFIAALSFFIGQAQVIPKAIRIYPLLALPGLTVLVTMLYWLWRIRVRRSLRGIATMAAADAA